MNKDKISAYFSKASKLLRSDVTNHANEIIGKTLLIKALVAKANQKGSKQLDLTTAQDWQSLLTANPPMVSEATFQLINEGGYYKSLAIETLVSLVILANKHEIKDLTGTDFTAIIVKIMEFHNRLPHYDDSFYPLFLQSMDLKEIPLLYSNSLMSLPILGKAVDVTDVNLEVLERLAIVYAFEELFVNHVDVTFTDIYTQAGNQSREYYAGGLIFPPIAQRIQSDEMKAIIENDKINRFNVPSRSTEILSIQHSFSEVDGRLIVLVAQGILFNTLEKPFRQHVIEQGKLKAIVFLPNGSLIGTNIATAMLVFDTEAHVNYDSVRFVDLEKAGYIQKNRRSVELINFDDLLAKIDSNEDFEGIVSISREQIQAEDYVLNAQRYPMTEEQKQFAKLIGNIPTTELVEIVKFERASPLFSRHDDNGISVLEVTMSDTEDGYLKPPSRKIHVPKRAINEYDKSFLQANDILISTKGSSAGKVTLVPETVPPAGENGWIANQFSLVLRLKKTAKISAEALFIYLRSPLGQKLLARFSEGTVMATLSLANLKTLPVLEITTEQNQQAQQIVKQDRAMIEQISQMQAEKEQRYQSLWTVER